MDTKCLPINCILSQNVSAERQRCDSIRYVSSCVVFFILPVLENNAETINISLN